MYINGPVVSDTSTLIKRHLDHENSRPTFDTLAQVLLDPSRPRSVGMGLKKPADAERARLKRAAAKGAKGAKAAQQGATSSTGIPR